MCNNLFNKVSVLLHIHVYLTRRAFSMQQLTFRLPCKESNILHNGKRDSCPVTISKTAGCRVIRITRPAGLRKSQIVAVEQHFSIISSLNMIRQSVRFSSSLILSLFIEIIDYIPQYVLD